MNLSRITLLDIVAVIAILGAVIVAIVHQLTGGDTTFATTVFGSLIALAGTVGGRGNKDATK